MRWLAVWLLLTLTYAAGWLVAGWLFGGPPPSREVAAHLAVVPLVQVAALALVAALRRKPPVS